MRRIVFAITMLAVTTSLVTKASAGQNPPQGSPTGQAAPAASGTSQAGPLQTMDLATAKKMVAAAEAAASAMNKHVTICVMDTNADVVLAERMDGTSHNAVISAQGKARAALIFGIPTGAIDQAIQDKKPISVAVKSLPTGLGGETTFGPGGLLIMKDGKIIGTIGVGGTTTDEKFAQAGIDAISVK